MNTEEQEKANDLLFTDFDYQRVELDAQTAEYERNRDDERV